MGECDLFLAGCGWVWVSVCVCVCVSAQFITALLKNMFYSVLQFQSDFLKLGNFYYDLVLLNRRPLNHKNKNVEEKSLVPRTSASPRM